MNVSTQHLCTQPSGMFNSDRSDRGWRGASCVSNDHCDVVPSSPFSVIVVPDWHAKGEQIIQHRLRDKIREESFVCRSAERDVYDIRCSIDLSRVISPAVLRYNAHNAQR